jgi:hypothetical protein
VTITVCSNWALGRPSVVDSVQPSSQRRWCCAPAVSIGSTVKTMPSTITVVADGSSVWPMWGEAWKLRPMPWPP